MQCSDCISLLVFREYELTGNRYYQIKGSVNGIINVYKPEGITSFGAIYRVKKAVGEKKAGHLGTLDPMAEGVLPVFLGKMTKLIPYLNQGTKVYRATLKLGASSTTLDREGEITEQPIPENVTEEKIIAAVNSFLGEIEQVPPMFSALKVGGKKLCDLARKGIEVERKPRKVTIFSIKNIEVRMPEVQFDVHCSKGTYIRTLGEDIGKRLGTSAYLTQLIRLACEENFTVDNAIDLDQIEKLNKIDIENGLIKVTELFPGWTHIRFENEQDIIFLGQGRSLRIAPESIVNTTIDTNEGCTLIMDSSDKILAVGNLVFSQDSPIIFKPSKVLI